MRPDTAHVIAIFLTIAMSATGDLGAYGFQVPLG
jgi:hypothetical protein